MTDTPRTDAEQMFDHHGCPVVLASFARTLERELCSANEKLNTVLRAVDKAEALNNTTPENEVAATASFNESMAQVVLEQTEKELAEAKVIIKQHREGVARFLVPWRSSLDKSWLDHFVKECGVEFDAIGFVKATALK